MSDPRFPIGEFALPHRLLPEQRDAAIERIATTPQRLRDAIAGLTDERLDTPYRAGGWTIRQVIHHLADSHVNSVMRFKLTLTEDVPVIRTYDEAKWAELPDYAGPVDVSLRLLEALHERWVLLLENIDDAQWQLTLNHPEWGVMHLDELLAMYAWHGDHHLAHITSLRDREGW